MKSKTKAASLVCAIALIAMCLSASPRLFGGQRSQTAAQPAQSDASIGLYLIQPNDVLTIFVYNHPELSLDVTVQPDGRISTPLAQSVQAAGLSSDQLKASLEKKLNEVIEIPNVNVIVKSIQSYRVFVIGKVQKPGILAFEKPITVVQALSLAGGFQEYAKKNEIVIIRTIPSQGANKQQDLRFNFSWDDFRSGKNPLQNIFLLNGDVVTID